ncbi:MAG: GatB/YqeY domain-containing protein [Rhodobacteraceae bacterium]|nr:GatB/YqeY domain-containing protein [Paracoccaceae bacterium]
MPLRERITSAMKSAMKEQDAPRLSTLRLINAAIKDHDINARAKGNHDGVDDASVRQILGKMVKQRQESTQAYEEGGRLELAAGEQAEIAVIKEFLPRQLSEAEIAVAIQDAITGTGARDIRDMGRVMGALKSKYSGQMDFGRVGPMVKDHLA